jgi:hypothetical protein
MFCAYVRDPRYQWDAECVRRFGAAPGEVFHEDNSVLPKDEYEGEPRRRPLTFVEVQALFDAADGLADEIKRRGRKGALSALRDSALLKTCYAFGLRRGELLGADLVDLRGNAKAPRFGRVGTFAVRHGKASRGGPSKRRTVLLVPEMDWVVDVLAHYLREVRGPLGKDASPALRVSERGSRLPRRAINEAFATARDAAGLDAGLDLHCLRHSHVTHLIEFDYPVRFVQVRQELDPDEVEPPEGWGWSGLDAGHVVVADLPDVVGLFEECGEVNGGGVAVEKGEGQSGEGGNGGLAEGSSVEYLVGRGHAEGLAGVVGADAFAAGAGCGTQALEQGGGGEHGGDGVGVVGVDVVLPGLEHVVDDRVGL